MPRHDTDVRLRHMLDATREAAQLAQRKTRADLDTDRPLNLSLVRLLEVGVEANLKTCRRRALLWRINAHRNKRRTRTW
jgi:hypothetical protein